MGFLGKMKKNISKGAKRLALRWQIIKCERKYNGKPLDEAQSGIREAILNRGDIYLQDENTARRLADSWNGTVQAPPDLRFIKSAVPVVLCVNETFAPYLAIMLQSLLDNSNPQRKYHFVIFGRALSDKTRECLASQAAGFPHCTVDFVDTASMLDGIPVVAVKHVSVDAYARLFIPYWLNKYEKVIYLDSDMIVRADIAELYDLDIGPHSVGICVSDKANLCIERRKYGYFMKRTAVFALLENWSRYINSGVLVFDTKKFAKRFPCPDVFRFAIYFTNRYAKRANDQDVLALLAKDEYFVLPPEWNYNWSTWADEGRYPPAGPEVKIVHFTGRLKPWKKNSLVNDNADAQEYRKYASNIPLYRDSQK